MLAFNSFDCLYVFFFFNEANSAAVGGNIAVKDALSLAAITTETLMIHQKDHLMSLNHFILNPFSAPAQHFSPDAS